MHDDNEPQWISIAELVRRTGGAISDSLVARMCRDGELDAINMGREGVKRARWLVRADALDRLYERQRAP